MVASEVVFCKSEAKGSHHDAIEYQGHETRSESEDSDPLLVCLLSLSESCL